ncbi:DNA repair protein XRCC4-like [Planoprotostelium fungivorum]|uniref:DNA repair protein XRCC4-like n=1 Tax=Planoprotostelium fungivorum TaxID=1890364 RepID=A0A2P6NT64_9EUKA|nr:DNA repair protein XRCC4-like [Planoprotostelium fungivorum]
MTERVVSRFHFDGEIGLLYLHSEWNSANGGFQLHITDGHAMWTGRGMDASEYYQLVRSALTQQDHKEERFSYALSGFDPRGSKDFDFVWKIKIDDNSFGDMSFFVKGSVHLVRCSAGDQKKKLRQFLDWLIDRSTVLEKQRDEALARFELLTSDKASQERDLYNKFLLVLNEKKKKIEEMKTEIERLKKQGPVSFGREESAVLSRKYSSQMESRSMHPASDSEDEKATPSLTFNASLGGPSQNNELLGMDDTYKIEAAVRKRRRPIPPPSQPADDLDNERLRSPPKKMVRAPSGEIHEPVTPTKPQPPIHRLFRAAPISSIHDGPRSPGVITPTPQLHSPAKKLVRKKQKTDLDADDLFDLVQ